MHKLLLLIVAMVTVLVHALFGLRADAETLTRIIHREDPIFTPRDANMTVGRDGYVYLTNGNNKHGCLLVYALDGSDKRSRRIAYAVPNA
ncbi:MAG: hypothetical protein ACOC9P_02360, partial [bacterium]